MPASGKLHVLCIIFLEKMSLQARDTRLAYKQKFFALGSRSLNAALLCIGGDAFGICIKPERTSGARAKKSRKLKIPVAKKDAV